MRTLKWKKVYSGGALSGEPVFDLKVQEFTVSSFFVNDSGGGTLDIYHVFDDEDGTAPVEALLESVTVSSGTGVTVKSYPYKAPYLRVKYSSNAASGTVRVNATTAR